MEKVIGIDIGGTAIKYGVLTLGGKCLEQGEMDTEASKGIEALLNKIYTVIDKHIDDKTVGIAVSGTGQIDGNIGKVIGGNPIIPGWIGTNLVEILEEKYNLPAVLENDVNCAALGEKWLGVGKDESDFLCLTIGTGIGGGIILDDMIYRGDRCVAGEFGHITIQRGGKQCSCGKKGCFERYASTSALVREVKERVGKELNGKEIFDCYRKNDLEIKEIVDEWLDYMTDGLGSLIYIFNPRLIVIGGGVTGQGEYLKNLIREKLDKKIGGNYSENLKIEFAKLGNSAGILGAEYLLLKKIGKI